MAKTPAKPKTPTKPRTPNKSAFIRNLPADMPASEVVTKAKAANLKLTPAFVYAIRSKVRNKGRKAPRPAAAPAGESKRGPKPRSGKPSASDFVRSQPATMKASDVVAAGAKQGLTFSTNLVYAVRSSGPKRARGGAAQAGGSASRAASGSESTFRKLSLDLGIARARSILDELERKLRQLIDG